VTKIKLSVMVLIETEDSRLFPENIDVSTAANTARLRRAVIENLPLVTRIVAVMGEEEARLMMAAHHHAMRQSGADKLFRPPPDYVPPTRD
jgi:hypothetical protein